MCDDGAIVATDPMTDVRRPGRATRLATALLALLAIGCQGIPRDPKGTLDRIRTERTFRVGLIAPGPDGPAATDHSVLVSRLASRTGAEPRIEHGAAERLLEELEKGDLDLVIGDMSSDTPWGTRVTLLPPLAEEERDGHTIALTVAARNGENAWITVLFEEVTALTGGSR